MLGYVCNRHAKSKVKFLRSTVNFFSMQVLDFTWVTKIGTDPLIVDK